jgi:hypothetical protein
MNSLLLLTNGRTRAVASRGKASEEPTRLYCLVSENIFNAGSFARLYTVSACRTIASSIALMN